MKPQLALGEFIEKLKVQPADNIVRFDFAYFNPIAFDSYRGYYDQLALGYEVLSNETTVATLLAECEKALGATYEGWKGGDFTMTSKTPLWVANPGENTHTAIVGVKDYSWATIIKTKYID